MRTGAVLTVGMCCVVMCVSVCIERWKGGEMGMRKRREEGREGRRGGGRNGRNGENGTINVGRKEEKEERKTEEKR